LDGFYSRWSQVWSGVPQGSVLGPVLFLIFINDLDDELTSDVLKFADDTKIYHPVNSEIEGGSLQQDLVTVSNWAKKWQMEFNVSKCKIIYFGKRNIGYKYSMNGHALEEVATEKDLGVTFSSDLKSATHCKEVYSKANRILGLISRTIKYKSPTVLINLYKSLVRPHLDYCSMVYGVLTITL